MLFVRIFKIASLYALCTLTVLLFIFIISTLVVFKGYEYRKTKTLVNGPEIYNDDEQGKLYSPFSFHYQPMGRLLLINFDNDPDDIYSGFEPQFFDDNIHGFGLMIIAWRVDGFVDIYHQPTLNLDPKLYDITGKGLNVMVERPMENARFVIKDSGVDTFFEFEDILGRSIKVTVEESSSKKRKPFGLLAPMGLAAENPSALPLVLLEDFYFVRRSNSVVSIEVAGIKRKAGSLPLPIDGSTMYFLRYSDNPTIATFNPEYDGPLNFLSIIDDTKAIDNKMEYKLVCNNGQLEILHMKFITDKQEIKTDFNPPLPNLLNIKENIEIKGDFLISSGHSIGKISGEYWIKRFDDTIEIKLIPSGGWHPNESKYSVKLMYLVNSDFRKWPQTYLWEAKLKLNEDGHVNLKTNWSRIDY